MRRNRSEQADPSLLEKVRAEFARFRNEHPGRRAKCPDEFRKVALAAVAGGHRVTDVEDAAGIARTSLARWRRDLSAAAAQKKLPTKAAKVRAPKPALAGGLVRELQIVKERHPNPAPATQTQGGGAAIIRLGPQLVIEVPVTSMTEAFLRTLAAASHRGGLL